MSLQNLRDAGGLFPSWAFALVLNLGFLSLFAWAYLFYEAQPPELISGTTLAAIFMAMVSAALVLTAHIVKAEPGNVALAVEQGAQKGLNMSWAATAISFLTYVCWVPGSALFAEYQTEAIIVVLAGALVYVGHLASRTGQHHHQEQAQGVASNQQLAIHPDFKPTPIQRPAYQASMADLTRLLAHQAGRAVGYAGSNVFFDDGFSLELDVNARVARVFSNMPFVNTEEFLYWRLHMLMMGPAAEKVLTGASSEAAIDDFTSFDELATRYLTLGLGRTFNAAPANMHEAAIKASRISYLRKNIYDRCLEACTTNRPMLVALVKVMRTRSVLTYGDIRSVLEQVHLPEGFPTPNFGNDEVLQHAQLEYEANGESVVEGIFAASPARKPDVSTDSEPSPAEAPVKPKRRRSPRSSTASSGSRKKATAAASEEPAESAAVQG